MRFAVCALIWATLFKVGSGERLGLVKRYVRDIIVTCPGDTQQIACAVSDGAWPTKDLPCGQKTIPHEMLKTLEDKAVDQSSNIGMPCPQSPPKKIKEGNCAKSQDPTYYCATMSHQSVEWTFYYSIGTVCNCAGLPGQEQCDNTKKHNEKECNLAPITFCGASTGTELCSV